MSFASLVEIFCEAILEVSWQATLLGLLVLGIRLCFGPWIKPELVVVLWFVLLVRLLMVGGPESPSSMSNFTGLQVDGSTGHLSSAGGSRPDQGEGLDLSYYLIRLLSAVWIIGVVISGARWLKMRQFYNGFIKQCELVGSPEILNALADAENDMGMDPQVTLVHTLGVTSPGLYGVFQPRLVIPTEMMQKLTQRQWYLIFRHELAHMKRGDLLLNQLIVLFKAIHWFNPLLKWVMIDMEIAADAAALKHSRTGDRKLYARTLLQFMTPQTIEVPELQPIRVSFCDVDDEILCRFREMARPPSLPKFGLIAGAFLILLLAAVGLTDPLFPRPVQLISFDTIRLIFP